MLPPLSQAFFWVSVQKSTFPANFLMTLVPWDPGQYIQSSYVPRHIWIPAWGLWSLPSMWCKWHGIFLYSNRITSCSFLGHNLTHSKCLSPYSTDAPAGLGPRWGLDVASTRKALRVGPLLIAGFVSVVWVGHHSLHGSDSIATVTTKQSSCYLTTN